MSTVVEISWRPSVNWHCTVPIFILPIRVFQYKWSYNLIPITFKLIECTVAKSFSIPRLQRIQFLILVNQFINLPAVFQDYNLQCFCITLLIIYSYSLISALLSETAKICLTPKRCSFSLSLSLSLSVCLFAHPSLTTREVLKKFSWIFFISVIKA